MKTICAISSILSNCSAVSLYIIYRAHTYWALTTVRQYSKHFIHLASRLRDVGVTLFQSGSRQEREVILVI